VSKRNNTDNKHKIILDFFNEVKNTADIQQKIVVTDPDSKTTKSGIRLSAAKKILRQREKQKGKKFNTLDDIFGIVGIGVITEKNILAIFSEDEIDDNNTDDEKSWGEVKNEDEDFQQCFLEFINRISDEHELHKCLKHYISGKKNHFSIPHSYAYHIHNLKHVHKGKRFKHFHEFKKIKEIMDEDFQCLFHNYLEKLREAQITALAFINQARSATELVNRIQGSPQYPYELSTKIAQAILAYRDKQPDQQIKAFWDFHRIRKKLVTWHVLFHIRDSFFPAPPVENLADLERLIGTNTFLGVVPAGFTELAEFKLEGFNSTFDETTQTRSSVNFNITSATPWDLTQGGGVVLIDLTLQFDIQKPGTTEESMVAVMKANYPAGAVAVPLTVPLPVDDQSIEWGLAQNTEISSLQDIADLLDEEVKELLPDALMNFDGGVELKGLEFEVVEG